MPQKLRAFYPGPGLGGHCIPIDSFYLTWKAREYDRHTRLIEAAGEINNSMPEFIVDKSSRILNKSKLPLNGSKVLIVGTVYKDNISDYRQSPALRVIAILNKNSAYVEVFDPFVKEYKDKGQSAIDKN